MRKERPNLEQFADAMAFLMKAPRTRHELALVLGVRRQRADVYVNVLQACGLIYECGVKRTGHSSARPAAIYAFQPSPYVLEDVPRRRST